ncbi:MAG: hypothetical protein WD398_15385 [Cyclobacteriaceae bacterium]
MINSEYLEQFSKEVAKKVGEDYFAVKQYMSGQEIIRLTPCTQLNLMVIKLLFDAWQEEIRLLKNNPYFDYGDYAVKGAMNELMNVLSRSIKINKTDFGNLLESAVKETVHLAVDPLDFFEKEMEKGTEMPNGYFKDLKKYLKWHTPIWLPVIDQINGSPSLEDLKNALRQQFIQNSSALEEAPDLLKSLDQLVVLDWNKLLRDKPLPNEAKEPSKLLGSQEKLPKEWKENDSLNSDKKSGFQNKDTPQEDEFTIDPAMAWARFESEEYAFMKGSIRNLQEDIGINQRYMFTKMLFDGNPDLMNQALHELDESDSFIDAINLLNINFVSTLKWDIHSDEVGELLQLIFRKFEEE